MYVAVVDLHLSIAPDHNSTTLPNMEEGSFLERSINRAVKVVPRKGQKTSAHPKIGLIAVDV